MAAVVALIAVLPFSADCEEKPTAQQILDKMDALRNQFKDQEMDIKLTVVDTDGSEKSYKFNLKQKGDDKRLIRFKSGEVKRMSVLTVRDSMHVFLPGYKRVRKIASHNMNQSFVGSDFNNHDMAIVSWSRFYDAELLKEDDASWHLTLVPRKGEKAPYPKIVMKIRKKGFIQTGTDYFDASGEKVKEFTVKEWETFPNGLEMGKVIEMKDPRTGHHTLLEIESFKVDQGFKDSMFSVRQLQWSR